MNRGTTNGFDECLPLRQVRKRDKFASSEAKKRPWGKGKNRGQRVRYLLRPLKRKLAVEVIHLHAAAFGELALEDLDG